MRNPRYILRSVTSLASRLRLFIRRIIVLARQAAAETKAVREREAANAAATEKVLTGRPFACSLQAHEKQTTSARQSASRPEGRAVPASKKQAYRIPAVVQPDSGAHDPRAGARARH